VNVRLWFCVALGVFTAHIAVFMLWTHFQPRPPLRVPPKNEFKVNEKALVDPNTGEKVVVREFTVSTQLATPAPSSKVE